MGNDTMTPPCPCCNGERYVAKPVGRWRWASWEMVPCVLCNDDASHPIVACRLAQAMYEAQAEARIRKATDQFVRQATERPATGDVIDGECELVEEQRQIEGPLRQ